MSTTQTVNSLAAELPAAALERMLYYLKLTRAAETRIEQVLYRQGKIVGGVYVGRGQEAIGVGSAFQIDRRRHRFSQSPGLLLVSYPRNCPSGHLAQLDGAGFWSHARQRQHLDCSRPGAGVIP